jgi:hypothetical protein
MKDDKKPNRKRGKGNNTVSHKKSEKGQIKREKTQTKRQ